MSCYRDACIEVIDLQWLSSYTHNKNIQQKKYIDIIKRVKTEAASLYLSLHMNYVYYLRSFDCCQRLGIHFAKLRRLDSKVHKLEHLFKQVWAHGLDVLSSRYHLLQAEIYMLCLALPFPYHTVSAHIEGTGRRIKLPSQHRKERTDAPPHTAISVSAIVVR